MKNWITILAVAVSFAICAQHGNGHSKSHGKDHGKPKGKQSIKINPGKNKGPIKLKVKPEKAKGNVGQGRNKMPNQKDANHQSKSYKSHVKHHSKFHYKKGHVNHIYIYSYSPFRYPTKNYGQWRSQQARNKHKSYPLVFELNVLNGIEMIQERNTFLLIEIDSKIARFNRLVVARHDAGTITDVQFSVHLGTIKRMKKQRGNYHY